MVAPGTKLRAGKKSTHKGRGSLEAGKLRESCKKTNGPLTEIGFQKKELMAQQGEGHSPRSVTNRHINGELLEGGKGKGGQLAKPYFTVKPKPRTKE